MSTLTWLHTMARMARPAPPASGDLARPGGAGAAWPPLVAGLDPITAPDDPETIVAATLTARRSDTDAETRLLWGRYAYRAAQRLWGGACPATIGIGRVYEQVLAAQDLSFDAVRVCEQRLAACEPGTDVGRALTSGCELAVALHRDGQCEQAEQQSRIGLRQWQASPHGYYGHAAVVLLTAAAVRAGCGQHRAAARVLTDDAAHLADLDPACRHAAAGWLATVTITHPHRCGATPPAPPASGTLEQQQRQWLATLETLPAAARPGAAHAEPRMAS
ncbi:hypothetical protein OWR29_39160 [Actinoplanes sp. Pm04-4]|uniref:Uncharacterized protein n=1 Tax=Paractinoplanes pyxinae TaxID=2997416 RepID=A0ABT4BC06_9ACTN|nr:hypothetical protein [Actinoplanes pyxinae]MCY1144051.1 hypothetical protein [Actinoplanes pyxinae]